MGVYGGIQLPNINEENLDDKKERKQILNYLALLDEKLRYMFQNIDIEENFSEESKGMFFEMGKAFKNLVQDNEGRMSMLIQEVDNITSIVVDPKTGLSAISQRADKIESTVRSMEGDVEDALSVAEQAADHFSWIVKSGSSASAITLTSNMIKAITNQVEIRADVNLYGYMTVWRDDGYDIEGGYIGYASGDDGVNASTSGIKLASDGLNSDDEAISYLIATNSGIRMTYQDPDDEDVKNGVMVTASGPGMVYEDVYSDEKHEVYCNSSGARMQYSDEDVTNYIRAMVYGIRMYAGDYRIEFDCDNGNLIPDDDGTQLLGESGNRWQGVYAKNGTIQTSDARKKEEITYDMERYEDFFLKLRPSYYKMVDGESGRFHVGFISQDVEKAMGETGLTSMDFAGFIKTPVYEKKLDSGRPDKTSAVIDHNYSLRYDEFVALNTHMIQKLMARVGELESKLEALS